MAPRVLVVGDAVLDARIAPSEPMRPGGDVPASIRLAPGGQGANVAVRLARRGAEVRLVCALGTDAAGEMVRAAMAADGVSLLDLEADATGIVVVLLDAEGGRSMFSQRVPLAPRMAASSSFGPAELGDGDWVVVSGYVLLEPSAGISASGPRPRRAVLGCSLDERQAPDWIQAAAAFAPHLLVVNHDEARALLGVAGPPAELARDLGQRLAALVVVTHAGGAFAAAADELVEVATEQVAEPVDTTGAGDAVAAALIGGLTAADWPPPPAVLRRAMSEAAELASAVTLVEGAQGRVPGEGGDA